MITTHSIPFIGGLTNIYLTKGFVMLPRDYTAVFCLGIMYIPFNYIGTIEEGKPLYPLADWVHSALLAKCQLLGITLFWQF